MTSTTSPMRLRRGGRRRPAPGGPDPAGRPRWWDEVRSLGTFGRSWAVGIFLFSAARALLAWPTLGRYGVDPWIFLAIDLVTAVPYGIAQAVMVKLMCRSERPWRDAAGWTAVVVATFLAPYGYIFAASGSMPLGATVGVVAWMLIFGALALWRTVRSVRAGRSATR